MTGSFSAFLDTMEAMKRQNGAGSELQNHTKSGGDILEGHSLDVSESLESVHDERPQDEQVEGGSFGAYLDRVRSVQRHRAAEAEP